MHHLQNLFISTLRKKLASKLHSGVSYYSSLSGLSQDLSLVLDDVNRAKDYNVIIKVGKHPNMKEFPAHSYILRARSPYFKNVFLAERTNKRNDMIMMKKTNINTNVFEMILK